MRKVVVWTSTNKCNLNCKFCFGKEKRAELGTQDAKCLIERVAASGTGHFVFSGGEPLLRKDIFRLATHARKCGMKTILHTNGILVDKGNAERITRNFETVNLPIDGADEEANARMGRGSLKRTLEVLGMLEGRAEITISTVATKMNLDEIPKIALLLEGRKIRKWRVFQFNPRLGEAKRNGRMFAIGGEEFRKLERRLHGAEFVPKSGKFEESYTLISSDGSQSF